ncbi:MAG: hypothetical protein GXO08_04380 [Aquificae bacterium]|nr:hypothetical protein [Aquificota bacterium]
MAKKLLVLLKDRVFPEVLREAKRISDRLGFAVEVYCLRCGGDRVRELLEVLNSLQLTTEVKGSDRPPKEVLVEERPYLTLLPKPRLNPLAHAFKKPWSEKLAEEVDEFNLYLVEEGLDEPRRALLYADRDRSSEAYLREAYRFLSALGVEFKFVTVFDERYYELLIKKEHPEVEAKEILGRMFTDYVNAVREKVKRALGLERVELIPLKGEEGRTLPYFARTHGFDLLAVSHAVESKEEIVENSETHLLLFKN